MIDTNHPLQQLPQRQIRRFGWKPDTPDGRDLLYTPQIDEVKNIPKEFSMRGEMPPVYDQGQLGSCTANAIGGVVQHQQMVQGEPEGQHVPSRLFIYYGERVIENSVPYDAGAEIRDGMKVVATLGSPFEEIWPYDISKFAEQPPQAAFDEAKKYMALKYARVRQTQNYIKAAIANRHAIAFGFIVYSSFEQIGSDGMMPIPQPDESQEGGHAVVAMGYNETHVEVRNSWSPQWGDKGYFWMPWSFILDKTMCNDFWTISLES